MGEDAPNPRLYKLVKYQDYEGYGFNLNSIRSKPGHFIGTVHPNSPAKFADLKTGDKIIEINGQNVVKEDHASVVSKVMSSPDSVDLLVVDEETEQYYKLRGVQIDSLMSQVKVKTCPRKKAQDGQPPQVLSSTPSPKLGSCGIPSPRLCKLMKSPNSLYGFTMQTKKGKPGHFISRIDPASAAYFTSLRVGDKIVEVNGHNVGMDKHDTVTLRVQSNPNAVDLLVVDSATENYYKTRGVAVHSHMSQVKVTVYPIKGSNLKELCCYYILQYVKKENIFKLSLPSALKQYISQLAVD